MYIIYVRILSNLKSTNPHSIFLTCLGKRKLTLHGVFLFLLYSIDAISRLDHTSTVRNSLQHPPPFVRSSRNDLHWLISESVVALRGYSSRSAMSHLEQGRCREDIWDDWLRRGVQASHSHLTHRRLRHATRDCRTLQKWLVLRWTLCPGWRRCPRNR